MAHYRVQAPDGKILTIDAEDENGVDAAMQDYMAATPKNAQMPSSPVPSGPSAVPLPIQQTPTVQGSGALNNKTLNIAADMLDSATPIGPATDLINNQSTMSQHPIRTAADIAALGLFALPGLGELRGASALVGPAAKTMAAGMGGAAAGTGIADTANITNPIARLALQMGGGISAAAPEQIGALAGAGKRTLLGNAVPKGEEASALVNTTGNVFGTPQVPQGAMNTGELRQAMAAGNKQLGGAVGAARTAAFDAAGNPENSSQMVSDALTKALENMGVKRNPIGATGPANDAFKLGLNPSAKPVVDVLNNGAPEVSSLADAYKLKQNLQNAAATAQKPLSTVTDTAPYLKAGGNAINEAINSHLTANAPEDAMKALADANAKFGANRTIQQMAVKSTTNGEFSPAKMVSQWKTLTPADKAAKFEPEEAAAYDSLFSQKQGVIQKIGNMLLKIPQMGAKTVLQGTKLGDLMQPSSSAVRFQAPSPAFPSNPLLDLVR